MPVEAASGPRPAGECAGREHSGQARAGQRGRRRGDARMTGKAGVALVGAVRERGEGRLQRTL